MNFAQYDMCWCMSLSLKLLVQFLKNFQGRGCFSQGAPTTKKKTLKETEWLLRRQKFIVLLRKLRSENPLT